MKPNGYSKREKLKSKKLIDAVFAEKNSIAAFPLRIFYIITPNTGANVILQAGVGCSKRNFKRAVHRNRVKRLMRESWRTHKAPLIAELKTLEHYKMDIFIHYAHSELPSLEMLNTKMSFLVQKLIEKIHDQMEKNH